MINLKERIYKYLVPLLLCCSILTTGLCSVVRAEEDLISSLSPELRAHVFQYVGEKDFGSIALVSKTFNGIAYQGILDRFRDIIGSLRKNLINAEEDKVEIELIKNQYKLLQLLYFYPAIVGKFSKLPDSCRKKLVQDLSGTISHYYDTLLTKVPRDRFNEIKTIISQVIIDRPEPDRTAQAIRASWVFFKLDCPKEVQVLLDNAQKQPINRERLIDSTTLAQNKKYLELSNKFYDNACQILRDDCELDENILITYLLYNELDDLLRGDSALVEYSMELGNRLESYCASEGSMLDTHLYRPKTPDSAISSLEALCAYDLIAKLGAKESTEIEKISKKCWSIIYEYLSYRNYGQLYSGGPAIQSDIHNSIMQEASDVIAHRAKWNKRQQEEERQKRQREESEKDSRKLNEKVSEN